MNTIQLETFLHKNEKGKTQKMMNFIYYGTIHRRFRAKSCVTKSSGMSVRELFSVDDAEDLNMGVGVSIEYVFHQNSDLHPPATYMQVSTHVYIYSQANTPPLYKPKTLLTSSPIHTHAHI